MTNVAHRTLIRDDELKDALRWCADGRQSSSPGVNLVSHYRVMDMLCSATFDQETGSMVQSIPRNATDVDTQAPHGQMSAY